MIGTWTEDGFVKVPLQVELDFGKGYHVRLWHCVCENKLKMFTGTWKIAIHLITATIISLCTFKKVLFKALANSVVKSSQLRLP